MKNSKERAAALSWFASNPLKHLILVRRVMEPLRQLLSSQLEVSSDHWEVTQQARVAAAIKSGADLRGARRFRVGIAADCVFEQEALQTLGFLFVEDDLWKILPEDGWTFRFRALAFKMISRAGACVYLYLQSAHEKCPYILFKLLGHPDGYQGVLDKLPCQGLQDEWTRSMIARHPTLTGEVFQAKLHLSATMCYTDIAGIEARHASLRRLLHTRSAQTNSLAVVDLGSLWVSQQAQVARTANLRLRKRTGRGAAKKAPTGSGIFPCSNLTPLYCNVHACSTPLQNMC